MRITRMQHHDEPRRATREKRAFQGCCSHGNHLIAVLLACALLFAGCGRTARWPSPEGSSDSNAAASGVTVAGKTSGTADKSSAPDAKATTDKGKKSAGKDDTLSRLEKEDVVALFSTLPETVTSQFLFQDILPENPEASSWHYMNGGGQYWKGTNEADRSSATCVTTSSSSTRLVHSAGMRSIPTYAPRMFPVMAPVLSLSPP